MTVGELRSILSGVDPEKRVVISEWSGDWHLDFDIEDVATDSLYVTLERGNEVTL